MAKEIKNKTEVAVEFMECDTCRAKAGSPILCRGCLHNRDAVQKLVTEINRLLNR